MALIIGITEISRQSQYNKNSFEPQLIPLLPLPSFPFPLFSLSPLLPLPLFYLSPGPALTPTPTPRRKRGMKVRKSAGGSWKTFFAIGKPAGSGRRKPMRISSLFQPATSHAGTNTCSILFSRW